MASNAYEPSIPSPSGSGTTTPQTTTSILSPIDPNLAEPTHNAVAQPSTDSSQYDIGSFNPISPYMLSNKRCRKRFVMPNDDEGPEITKVKFKRRKTRKLRFPPEASGWSKNTHPEGQVYFWHAALKTYTLTWMFDKDLAYFVNIAAHALRQIIDKQRASGATSDDATIPADAAIILDVFHEDGNVYFSYYLASRSERQVFWLDEVEIELITREEVAIFNECHLESAEEALYWKKTVRRLFS